MSVRVLPARFGRLAFAVTLAGINTSIISAIGVSSALGSEMFQEPQLAGIAWLHAFLSAWPVGFLLVFLFAPQVRRLVHWLTKEEQVNQGDG